MKIELAMKREGTHLVPATLYDQEVIGRISKAEFMVEVHQNRHPEHHKKLWAIAARVADFCDDFQDAEDAVDWAKLQIPSMRKEYVFNDGKVVMAVKSISFASMDQIKFERFYDRAIALWSARIGCDAETLEGKNGRRGRD